MNSGLMVKFVFVAYNSVQNSSTLHFPFHFILHPSSKCFSGFLTKFFKLLSQRSRLQFWVKSTQESSAHYQPTSKWQTKLAGEYSCVWVSSTSFRNENGAKREWILQKNICIVIFSPYPLEVYINYSLFLPLWNKRYYHRGDQCQSQRFLIFSQLLSLLIKSIERQLQNNIYYKVN